MRKTKRMLEAELACLEEQLALAKAQLRAGLGNSLAGEVREGVLSELRACGCAWEPECRILGNVRAIDVVRFCDLMRVMRVMRVMRSERNQ